LAAAIFASLGASVLASAKSPVGIAAAMGVLDAVQFFALIGLIGGRTTVVPLLRELCYDMRWANFQISMPLPERSKTFTGATNIDSSVTKLWGVQPSGFGTIDEASVAMLSHALLCSPFSAPSLVLSHNHAL
jgi:hypothetical protein